MQYRLRCLRCNAVFESTGSQLCPKCGGLLEVEYREENEKLRKVEHAKAFWDLEDVLPKGHYKHFEIGFTKLVELERLGAFAKLEFQNPTGSFKDRGSVIEVAKAKEYGYDKVVCASTGNMAYSISYFAKLYGLEAVVFISRSANKDKLLDIKSTHDAELHLINGDFTKAQHMAEAYAKENNAFLTGDYCYRKEGQSTIGFELFAQMPEANNIIMPIGNGTLFSAVYKAYDRLKQAGVAKSIPKLIGVQASNTAPVVHAKGNEIKYEKPKTKADAIAVGYPTYGMQVLEAVRQTSGMLVTATDAEMEREQKLLMEQYAIKAELAGVASIAAYKKLKPRLKGKTILLITGSNL